MSVTEESIENAFRNMTEEQKLNKDKLVEKK